MISNGTLKKKKIKKNFSPISIHFSQEHRRFQSIISKCLQQNNTQSMEEFFRFYNLTQILQPWDTFDCEDKITILREISLRSCDEHETIHKFQPKQKLDSIYILIKGSVDYKMRQQKNQYQFQYLTRPGQVLCQPFISEQLDYKSFSLFSTSPCLLLKLPFLSKLKQEIWKRKQTMIDKLILNITKFAPFENDSRKLFKMIPYFCDVTFKRNQKIFPDKVNTNYICFIAKGQIMLNRFAKNGKQISLLNKVEGQIFALEKEEPFSLQCKSSTCVLCLVPEFFIHKIGLSELLIVIDKKDQQIRSFRNSIFSKTQNFLKNPQKLIRLQNKKKSNKKRAFSVSTEKNAQEDRWDLIVQSKNLKKKSERMTSYHKNAASESSIKRVSLCTILERKTMNNLKRTDVDLEEELNFCRTVHYEPTNMFKNYVKSPSKAHPQLISLMGKQAFEKKKSLLNSTKFGLIRYAKEESNSILIDHFS